MTQQSEGDISTWLHREQCCLSTSVNRDFRSALPHSIIFVIPLCVRSCAALFISAEEWKKLDISVAILNRINKTHHVLTELSCKSHRRGNGSVFSLKYTFNLCRPCLYCSCFLWEKLCYFRFPMRSFLWRRGQHSLIPQCWTGCHTSVHLARLKTAKYIHYSGVYNAILYNRRWNINWKKMSLQISPKRNTIFWCQEFAVLLY